MDTIFLSPRDKMNLMKLIKEGDDTAEATLWSDYDRLESRIKTLEMHIQNLCKATNESLAKKLNPQTAQYLSSL